MLIPPATSHFTYIWSGKRPSAISLPGKRVFTDKVYSLWGHKRSKPPTRLLAAGWNLGQDSGGRKRRRRLRRRRLDPFTGTRHCLVCLLSGKLSARKMPWFLPHVSQNATLSGSLSLLLLIAVTSRFTPGAFHTMWALYEHYYYTVFPTFRVVPSSCCRLSLSLSSLTGHIWQGVSSARVKTTGCIKPSPVVRSLTRSVTQSLALSALRCSGHWEWGCTRASGRTRAPLPPGYFAVADDAQIIRPEKKN